MAGRAKFHIQIPAGGDRFRCRLERIEQPFVVCRESLGLDVLKPRRIVFAPVPLDGVREGGRQEQAGGE